MKKDTKQKLILAPKIAILCLAVILPLVGNLQAQSSLDLEIISHIEKLKDRNQLERLNAVKALRKIGSPAISALTVALREEETEIRGGAAFALGAIGQEARSAIPHLIEMLKDNDEQVRLDAAVALRRIGFPAVAALTEALQSKDVQVKRGATFALAGIGTQAKETVPMLIEMLKDNDEQVRLNAAIALRGIGSPAVPELNKALQDKNERVRRGAAIALGKATTSNVPSITKKLRGDDRPSSKQLNVNRCASFPAPTPTSYRPGSCAMTPTPRVTPTPAPRVTPKPIPCSVIPNAGGTRIPQNKGLL
ncbi:MAG TPA: HEAT repeat domain-containing protein [Leptolyngbyaceae cyanobacterium]